MLDPNQVLSPFLKTLQFLIMKNRKLYTEDSEEKFDIDSPEFGSPINYSFSRENKFISTFQENELFDSSRKYTTNQK